MTRLTPKEKKKKKKNRAGCVSLWNAFRFRLLDLNLDGQLTRKSRSINSKIATEAPARQRIEVHNRQQYGI